MTGRRIVLIVAMDRDNAIGRDGDMPWHLPADLAHFKRTTQGHAVIMGRRTFESIGRPLPDRQNIVLSRSDAALPGVEVVDDLNAAIALASSDTVYIIGGGEIYRQALQRADELIVTHVDTRVVDADTWFPEIDPAEFERVQQQRHPADDRNAHDLIFVHYRRRD